MRAFLKLPFISNITTTVLPASPQRAKNETKVLGNVIPYTTARDYKIDRWNLVTQESARQQRSPVKATRDERTCAVPDYAYIFAGSNDLPLKQHTPIGTDGGRVCCVTSYTVEQMPKKI